jgi:hypothetical protein
MVFAHPTPRAAAIPTPSIAVQARALTSLLRMGTGCPNRQGCKPPSELRSQNSSSRAVLPSPPCWEFHRNSPAGFPSSLRGFVVYAVAMKRVAAILAIMGLIAAAAPAAAEKPTVVCTLIGCQSGIRVHLGHIQRLYVRAASLRLCVDQRCWSKPIRPESENLRTQWRGVPRSVYAHYHVSVYVLDASGRVLMRADRTVTLTKNQPNGSECEPTCYGAYLVLEAREARLRIG